MSRIANASVSALLAAKAPAPATKAPVAEPALVWENIDPATLPDDLREMFYAIAKARSAFEAKFTDLVSPPDHLTVKFGYKFGLSVALAPRSAPRSRGDYAAFIRKLG